MLDPLTPTEVVAAIGAAARAAARSEDPGDAFSRGQLRSASSSARHLAVELESFDAERRALAATVADALDGHARHAAVARRLRGAGDARDVRALAGTLCALLAELRADPLPEAAALRAQVHTALRAMADREVDLLAAAIEPAP